jgi:hypothetical protein
MDLDDDVNNNGAAPITRPRVYHFPPLSAAAPAAAPTAFEFAKPNGGERHLGLFFARPPAAAAVSRRSKRKRNARDDPGLRDALQKWGLRVADPPLAVAFDGRGGVVGLVRARPVRTSAYIDPTDVGVYVASGVPACPPSLDSTPRDAAMGAVLGLALAADALESAYSGIAVRAWVVSGEGPAGVRRHELPPWTRTLARRLMDVVSPGGAPPAR